jgi:hypothetical protein
MDSTTSRAHGEPPEANYVAGDVCSRTTTAAELISSGQFRPVPASGLENDQFHGNEVKKSLRSWVPVLPASPSGVESTPKIFCNLRTAEKTWCDPRQR